MPLHKPDLGSTLIKSKRKKKPQKTVEEVDNRLCLCLGHHGVKHHHGNEIRPNPHQRYSKQDAMCQPYGEDLFSGCGHWNRPAETTASVCFLRTHSHQLPPEFTEVQSDKYNSSSENKILIFTFNLTLIYRNYMNLRLTGTHIIKLSNLQRP